MNLGEETKGDKQRRLNAEKAYQAAAQLFPGERWKLVENGIFLSPHRAIGKKSNYEDELRDAQILRDFGSTVYLTPENRSDRRKKYDAIVDGMKFEFKNIEGNANTLQKQFLRSRSQAQNVFFNLEKSSMTRHEIMSALYGARNSKTHTDNQGKIIKGYADSNDFTGGRIILKIKEYESLIYLEVDSLKIPEK